MPDLSQSILHLLILLMCCRFDLLANGGACLTLSFERAPFLTQYRTVWVPWNVFYVMDTLILKKVSSNFMNLFVFMGMRSQLNTSVWPFACLHWLIKRLLNVQLITCLQNYISSCSHFLFFMLYYNFVIAE